MKKGKKSVSKAILEALRDIKISCGDNCMIPCFTLYGLCTRVRAYVGISYRPSDGLIERDLRKLRQRNKINYTPSKKGNGIYTFELDK